MRYSSNLDWMTPTAQTRSDVEIVLIGGEGKERRIDTLESWNVECTSHTSYPDVPTPIYGFAATVHDNRVYIFGGTDEDDEELRSVEVFDLLVCIWCRGVPSLNYARTGAMAGVLGTKLCVAGGNGGDAFGYLDSVEQLCANSGTAWSPLAELCVARADAASTSYSNSFYVLGGRNGSQVLRSVEVFDQDFGIWQELPPMQVPRARCGAVGLHRRIIAAGGFNDSFYLNSVEVFSIDKCSWTEVAGFNVPRASFGMSVVGEAIYVLGGRNSGTVLDSVEQCGPDSCEWKMASPLCTARACFGIALKPSVSLCDCVACTT